jgi:hypothetical protein
MSRSSGAGVRPAGLGVLEGSVSPAKAHASIKKRNGKKQSGLQLDDQFHDLEPAVENPQLC